MICITNFWYQLLSEFGVAISNHRRKSMNWERLARANTHPLRVSILEVLTLDKGRTLSPSDLSYELRTPLSNVNYHVTELHRTGLVDLTDERPVRGATEHFYREANGAGPSRNGHGNGRKPSRSRSRRRVSGA
jgi:helix-turn-helix protein